MINGNKEIQRTCIKSFVTTGSYGQPLRAETLELWLTGHFSRGTRKAFGPGKSKRHYLLLAGCQA